MLRLVGRPLAWAARPPIAARVVRRAVAPLRSTPTSRVWVVGPHAVVPRRAVSDHGRDSKFQNPPTAPRSDPNRHLDVRFQVIDGARQNLHTYAQSAHRRVAWVVAGMTVALLVFGEAYSRYSRAAAKRQLEALKLAIGETTTAPATATATNASATPSASDVSPSRAAAAAAAAAARASLPAPRGSGLPAPPIPGDVFVEMTEDDDDEEDDRLFTEWVRDETAAQRANLAASMAAAAAAQRAATAADSKAQAPSNTVAGIIPVAKAEAADPAAAVVGHRSPAYPAGALPADAPDWVRRVLTSDGNGGGYGVYEPYRESTLRSAQMAKHLMRGALAQPNLIAGHWYVVQHTPYALPVIGADGAAPTATAAADFAWPQGLAVIKLGDGVCGHPGVVHGGLTSALIDSVTGAMANAVHSGNLTANLNINYRKPIPANTYVLVRTKVTGIERRKIFLDCSVEGYTTTTGGGAPATLETGAPDAPINAPAPVVYAEAKALYVMMDQRHRQAVAAAAPPGSFTAADALKKTI